MSGFLAEITLFHPGSDAFMNLIPEQRVMVNELMAEGIITSYAVSADRKKMWCVLETESMDGARAVIDGFPLSPFMEAEFFDLLFHNVHSALIGSISLN